MEGNRECYNSTLFINFPYFNRLPVDIYIKLLTHMLRGLEHFKNNGKAMLAYFS
jgi:hypothetical protein